MWQNKAPRVVIPLSEILKLERSDIKPYCLILETKDGRRYLLTFRNDSELYDWQDQISRREDMGVSSPRNFKHIVHVGVDHRNQTYTGLPAEWAKQLSYPQGKLHPTFSRPPPKDVPEDVAPEKHFVHVTLEHPGDTGHIATLLPV
ncbi:hypothetical protein C8R44DRAFT_631423 [Mycena epipterygia]|nr:hypothetical protein C8R44DRAFT_631423 [Mycena epipterygia]